LNITLPQDAIVGQFLLQAITAVLGADDFKGELYGAWAAAYWLLAHILIDHEASLYTQAGWVGWKEFRVQKRVQESNEIVGFYRVPKGEAPKRAGTVYLGSQVRQSARYVSVPTVSSLSPPRS
jgi:nitric oxide dioxygenase